MLFSVYVYTNIEARDERDPGYYTFLCGKLGFFFGSKLICQ